MARPSSSSSPDVGVRLASDANNLCDLGEIGTTPRLLATATISAQAELPFEQAQRPINATPLTKQLFHLAGKSLDCVAEDPDRGVLRRDDPRHPRQSRRGRPGLVHA